MAWPINYKAFYDGEPLLRFVLWGSKDPFPYGMTTDSANAVGNRLTTVIW